ncbi:MAG: DUF4384 domain-containing protein [Aureispira sp.]|nr:DUF4384 domain-containing protein [Aureispira sp.]
MKLKYLLILILNVLIVSATIAQRGRPKYGRQLSGTKVTDEQKAFMRGHLDIMAEFTDTTNSGIIEFPVKIHVVQKSDGSEGTTVDEVKQAIKKLNTFFLKIYVRFVPLGDYNYINNDFFHKFNKDTEDEFCKTQDVPNVINLYIVGSIKSGYSSYCGYTYPPSSTKNVDRIFIAKKYLDNGVTLARQAGHYFSLYPTHGPDEDKRSDELVNGTNCATTGDCICDTPADPKLDSRSVDERCGYIGQMKDGNNKFYRPALDNIMCDNPRFECRKTFTNEQYKRMQYCATYIRKYITFPKNEFSKKQLKSLMLRSGVEASMDFKVNGSPMPVELTKNLYKGKWPCQAGDEYQIDLMNSRKGYIYVLEGDKQRGVNVVYPGKNDKIYFKDERTFHIIPQEEGKMFKIDNNKGRDGLNYVCVLFSKKQLAIKDYVKELRSVRGDWDLMQIVYQVFGQHLVPAHDIEYSPKSVKFTSITAERYIVPVFMELEQE